MKPERWKTAIKNAAFRGFGFPGAAKELPEGIFTKQLAKIVKKRALMVVRHR